MLGMLFDIFLFISTHILMVLFSVFSRNGHWMRRNVEWSLNDQLCQKYSYQKLLKSIILLKVTIEKVQDVFWNTVEDGLASSSHACCTQIYSQNRPSHIIKVTDKTAN